MSVSAGNLMCLQISSIGLAFLRDLWYEVELLGLGQGSSGFMLIVDGQTVAHTQPEFSGIDFNIFSGPLYIGGHPELAAIQVRSRHMAMVHEYIVLL